MKEQSKTIKKLNKTALDLKKLSLKYKNMLKKHKNIENINSANQTSKDFCKMLLVPRCSSAEWPEKQRDLAQNINFKSATCYNFMRNTLEFNLPSQSSLNRWIPLKNLQPGFNISLLTNLKNQILKMTDDEKLCSILMDEIKIKKELTYNQVTDEVDGFIDFGDGDRNNNTGDHILVFMVRGIVTNWKYILSYYVSGNCTEGETLKDILLKNIQLTLDLNLNVKAIICDQGSNNRKCFRLLKITTDEPFFKFQNHKIYAIFIFTYVLRVL